KQVGVAINTVLVEQLVHVIASGLEIRAEFGGMRATRPAIVLDDLVAVLTGVSARVGLRCAHGGPGHGDVGGAGFGWEEVGSAGIGEAILEPAKAQFVDR